MTSAPVRRPLRRLPLALVVAAFGAALVVVPGGPAVAQAKRSVQIDGTAANQWVPANVAIKPGGTVTFRVADGQTHPVGSGATPPARDKRFDDSNCQPPQHMAKVGASCTVTFPKGRHLPVLLRGALQPRHEGRCHGRVWRPHRVDDRHHGRRRPRGHRAVGAAGRGPGIRRSTEPGGPCSPLAPCWRWY
jgi:plastocyanin